MRDPLNTLPALAMVIAGLLVPSASQAQTPPPSSEATFAVISLGAPGTPNSDVVTKVRDALVTQKVKVMSMEETRARLRGPKTTGEAGEEARLQAIISDVDKLYLASKYKDALAACEQVIKLLETDSFFTLQKANLLRTARLKASNILLTMAGGTETGRANTPEGKRAKAVLSAAVRAEPGLTMSAADFTPRLRLLLDHARAEVAAQPRGSLVVESQPPGIPVFFEGQEIGFTPLNVAKVAPHGRYRVWLQQDDHRSLQQWVEMGANMVRVDVDYAFESLLLPSVPGVDVDPLDLSEDLAKRLATVLGATHVVFTKEYSRDAGQWGGVVVYSVEGGFIRRGAVALQGAGSIPALAAFAATGEASGEIKRFSPPYPAMDSAERVAVLPAGSGPVVEGMDKGFREALKQVPGLELQPREETQRHLDEAKSAGATCAAHDLPCRVALGKRMEVGTLVALRVVEGNGEYKLDVQIVDVDAKRMTRRADGCTLGNATTSRQMAAAHAVRLLAPALYRSKLEVRSAVEGVRLLVDGVDEGAAPLKAPLDMMPGRHVVRVVGKPGEAGDKSVDLPYGTSTVLVAERSGGRLVLTTLSAPVAPPGDKGTEPTVETPKGGGRPVWALPLAGGGGVGALAGVAGMLGGLVMAVAGSALVATFPRTADGRLGLVAGESEELGGARLVLAGILIPAGLGVGVVGMVVLLAGVGAAIGGMVGGVVMGGE